MVVRPVRRGRIRHGTSTNRNRLRCSTTRASISGYSSGKLALNTERARAIDADKPGSGIAHRTAQNRPQYGAKENDAHRPQNAGMFARPVDKARADHHLAAFALQRFENFRDIARIVLPVAIHADHVIETQFVRELIARLHRAAQSQMMRQRQNSCAGRPRRGHRIVDGAVVHHQHRHSRHHGAALRSRRRRWRPASL